MRINKLELLMTCTCLSLIMSSQKANAEHRIQYAPADAQKIANEENNSISFTYSHGSRVGTALTASDAYSPDEGNDNEEDDAEGFNEAGWNAEGINKDTGTEYDSNGYDVNGIAAWADGNGEVTDASCNSFCEDNRADSDLLSSYGFDVYDVAGCYTSKGTRRMCHEVIHGKCDYWTEEPYESTYCVDADEASNTAHQANGDGTCSCSWSIYCFTGDMPVTLADGSTKRADEICYDDELLVWNFDDGKFASAKPIWIKIEQVAQEYNYMRFSDGSVLKTINQHRIFNQEAGKFTYPMTDDTPLGTHTLNSKGELVALVEKKIVKEEVKYYNIMTERYINCFVGGVLTSCRLNNIYPIKDLKFVKDNRKIVPYEQFAELDRKWYDGLRLGEQPSEINHKGDVDFNDKSLVDYVKRNLKIMA